MKLTEEQVKELATKDWIVKPNGCYLHLYREDYSEIAWEGICETIGSSSENSIVTVLIFGYVEK